MLNELQIAEQLSGLLQLMDDLIKKGEFAAAKAAYKELRQTFYQ